MPLSINSTTGTQMLDGNTLSRSQTAGLLPDQIIDSGSLLTIKGGVTFDGDNGITTSADPTIRLVRGDNVYTRITVISATSSWTVPTDVTKGYVIVVGGGGSGGAGGRQGGDTPRTVSGGAGGLGGAAASFIPLVAANVMPATIGAATGTSTFFGISATGGTNGTNGDLNNNINGTPGISGTSTTGNIQNGNIGAVWPLVSLDANSFGQAKDATAIMKNVNSVTNFPTTSGGYPTSTAYSIANIYRPGSGGSAGFGSQIPQTTTPPGGGLAGAVIIFY
jgi:hypothetical protein